MNYIATNEGLSGISELVFSNLKIEDLEKCKKVNRLWENILKKPSVWLDFCTAHGLEEDIRRDWSMNIRLSNHPCVEEDIILQLRCFLSSLQDKKDNITHSCERCKMDEYNKYLAYSNFHERMNKIK